MGGRQSSVREATKELRNRSGHPAPEGSEQIRQMAQVHPSPETEGCPPDQTKVPPAINQFYSTLDRQTATQLFKLLDKYRPETKYAKKERLREGPPPGPRARMTPPARELPW